VWRSCGLNNPGGSISVRVLYLNGGFDLELRGGVVPPRLSALLPEMTLWFLAVGLPRDTVVADVSPNEEFLEYLLQSGLGPPRIAATDSRLTGHVACPWGWSRSVLNLFRNCGAVVDAPSPETVKRVNGRAFSHGLASRFGVQVPGSRLCRGADQVYGVLTGSQCWPMVVKPEHGNTGIGFAVVKSPGDVRRAMDVCAGHLARGPVVVEPWLKRTQDVSMRFELAQDGSLRDLRMSRCLVTLSGASYGVLHVPGDPALTAWRGAMEQCSRRVADALSAEGYFGPVNIDGMGAVVDGRETLFPLLEVNARQSLSYVGYRVQERVDPTWPFLLRTIGRRRAGRGISLAEWRDALSRAAATTRGRALLLSPPVVGHGTEAHAAHRYILYMTAPDASELSRLDTRVTEALPG